MAFLELTNDNMQKSTLWCHEEHFEALAKNAEDPKSDSRNCFYGIQSSKRKMKMKKKKTLSNNTVDKEGQHTETIQPTQLAKGYRHYKCNIINIYD
jgi:hypothetical protein